MHQPAESLADEPGVLQERAIDFAAFFDEGCQVDGLGRTVKAQATVEEVVGLDEAIVRSIEHVEKFRSILFIHIKGSKKAAACADCATGPGSPAR
mmetsp:Transcript_44519/g.92001  ORF Transcript_44519/g.92001 Transcript_44519/m.92001 type:complete len:95 (+) Transcript_44519:121-405(+)